jgi:hypothetical protein
MHSAAHPSLPSHTPLKAASLAEEERMAAEAAELAEAEYEAQKQELYMEMDASEDALKEANEELARLESKEGAGADEADDARWSFSAPLILPATLDFCHADSQLMMHGDCLCDRFAQSISSLFEDAIRSPTPAIG